MHSRWNDADAREAIEGYAKRGRQRGPGAAHLHHAPARRRSAAGAARRRQHLGQDAMPDLLGETHEVLCVKGSGWDMASIEPAGLPAVKLAPLRKLRALDGSPTRTWSTSSAPTCSIRSAPNPSVETLLHAFLPHKFIDHTHAAAVLSLVDQPNGAGAGRGGLRRQHGLRALRHPGLRPRQAGGRRVRRQPRRRRADPRTSTASSPSARARGKPTSA